MATVWVERLKWVMGVAKVYLSARFGGCDIEWIESIDRKTCRLFYAKKILLHDFVSDNNKCTVT